MLPGRNDMPSCWKPKVFFPPRIWREPTGWHIEHWGVFRSSELEELLEHGRRLIYDKLPKKTREVLAMPPSAQRKLLKERKKLLAARARPVRS